MTPQRIQLRRTKGWTKPADAVVVARPTRWGNPFVYRGKNGLVRQPGVLTGEAWEFEGRISRAGTRHDMHMAGGQVHEVHVRWASRAELVDLYRRALTRRSDRSMTMAWADHLVKVTVEDVRRALAGRDLACWCPLVDEHGDPVPCHADVLLEIANGPTAPTSGGPR